MLRLLTATCLSLGVAGCSMGYVSLPLASPGPSLQTGSSKTALGGPVRTAALPVKPTLAPRQSEMASPGALDLINELRHAKGLRPLVVNAQLTRAAQMQAANLARTGTLTHIGPDGTTPLDRVRMTGYRPKMAAESIAGGQENVVEVFRTWRENDSHLRNLLLADATEMGVAQVSDPRSGLRTYWTLVLGAPQQRDSHSARP